ISVIREIAEKLIKFNTKKNQGIRKLLIASIPSLFARNFFWIVYLLTTSGKSSVGVIFVLRS
ncbi:hypothetical protein, partial [Escherichia coli]|uniref:hypothetical protein n=1 Tax=Escherichia coli TaxID=562 RepID=UPI001BA4E9A2